MENGRGIDFFLNVSNTIELLLVSIIGRIGSRLIIILCRLSFAELSGLSKMLSSSFFNGLFKSSSRQAQSSECAS
ncbi:unnamed protein product [Schistosoma mattheei]|uniref:Uncharacterized protein n=1 Tax=Schistosoma mattheei TaxID=31246 RepID=A0A3P7XIV6_9TREM|nr:unnamed protein product [Schistosoma mattheei]